MKVPQQMTQRDNPRVFVLFDVQEQRCTIVHRRRSTALSVPLHTVSAYVGLRILIF